MKQPRATTKRYHHGDLREALLRAGEQELIEKGFEGFTLRGVAKRANVSHAAPAHHFRDTQDLLTALAAIGIDRFYRSMTEAQARAAPDPRSQFIASGEGYVAYALANPALFDLMFGSKRPDFKDPDMIKASEKAFMILVDAIAAMTGENPLQTRDGRLSIMSAWSIVHGLANLVIANRWDWAKADLDADLFGTVRGVVEKIALDIERDRVSPADPR